MLEIHSSLVHDTHLTTTLAKMVYYHTSNTVSPAAFIYVGKDKVESIAVRDAPK